MNKKTLTIVLVIVLVLVGLGIWANKALWLFTPAYSQRNTVATFLADVNKGKNTDAYNLTSTTYQKDNNLSSFESAFDQLNGNISEVNYVAYSTTTGYVNIIGTTTNKTKKENTKFGILVVSQDGKSKIGAAVVTIIPD